MTKLVLPLAGMSPDTPEYAKPGMKLVRNMIPLSGGAFGQSRRFAAASATSLGARVTALTSVFTSSGYVRFAGTGGSIFMGPADVTTFAAKSTGHSITGNAWWAFAAFERNRKMIAVPVDGSEAAPSVAILSKTYTSASASFSVMISSTEQPKAKCVGIIGQFVVLGNITSTADGYRPTRVHWSAFGDETDFDPDAATQCDFEDLGEGGPVLAITSGTEHGLIFQRNRVCTMRYVGGTTIFDIRPIAYAPGLKYARSVVAHEGVVYYISDVGFMAIEGLSVKRIGADKIDKYFADQGMFNNVNVAGAPDPARKIVWWMHSVSSNDYADNLLGYKYDSGDWVELVPNVPIEAMGYIFSSGDAPFLGVFNTTHQLGELASTTAADVGVIETGAIQPVVGKRWQLNGVRFIGDVGGRTDTALSPDIQVSIRAMDRPDPPGALLPSYSTAVPQNVHGWNPVRVAGNYLQIRASISTSSAVSFPHRWQALELDYEVLGDR